VSQKNTIVVFALYTVSLEKNARGNPAADHRKNLARNMTMPEVESAAALAAQTMMPGTMRLASQPRSC